MMGRAIAFICLIAFSTQRFNQTFLAFVLGSLEAVVKKSLPFSSSSYDVVILHAGVNDASCGLDSFPAAFRSSCDFAGHALGAAFRGSQVVLSLPCLTSDSDVNARVAVANQQLRDLSLARGFGLISNDNIRITDLTDVVHLNAVGTARLYHNVLSYLRAVAT